MIDLNTIPDHWRRVAYFADLAMEEIDPDDLPDIIAEHRANWPSDAAERGMCRMWCDLIELMSMGGSPVEYLDFVDEALGLDRPDSELADVIPIRRETRPDSG